MDECTYATPIADQKAIAVHRLRFCMGVELRLTTPFCDVKDIIMRLSVPMFHS